MLYDLSEHRKWLKPFMRVSLQKSLAFCQALSLHVTERLGNEDGIFHSGNGLFFHKQLFCSFGSVILNSKNKKSVCP